MKKLLAILLALVIVLGLCACGGGSDKGGASSGDELTEDGRIKLTVGITSNARVLSYDDNALTDWVEEQCGVELVLTLQNSENCLIIVIIDSYYFFIRKIWKSC